MINDAVLLSIYPEWANLFYSRDKLIEWRKSFPFRKKDLPFLEEENDTLKMLSYKTFLREPVTNYIYKTLVRVYLYETSPIKKITGCIIIDSVDMVQNSDLINYNIIQNGCVDSEQLIDYAKGGNLFAWRIKDYIKFNKPFNLSVMTKNNRSIKKPPQSWCYCDDLMQRMIDSREWIAFDPKELNHIS